MVQLRWAGVFSKSHEAKGCLRFSSLSPQLLELTHMWSCVAKMGMWNGPFRRFLPKKQRSVLSKESGLDLLGNTRTDVKSENR